METNEKMVVVVREDLIPGSQAVQGGHALADFIFQYPERAKEWHDNSNYLIFLSIENEEKLMELYEKCKLYYLKVTIFREPDLDDSVTAIAIEPSEATQKLTKKLKLLLKNEKTI